MSVQSQLKIAPANGASVAFEAGDEVWATPGNITDSDNSRANAGILTSGEFTEGLEVTGFGFAIEPGARVVGFEANVERQGAGLGSCKDSTIQLLINGVRSGDNKAAAGNWPGADAIKAYGSATDDWGLDQLLGKDMNRSNFGLVVRVEHSAGGDVGARVDHVTMTVHYISTVGRSARARRTMRSVRAISA